MSGEKRGADSVTNEMRNAQALDIVNQDLYRLLQTTNVDMDYEVFCIIVDCLRKGVSPEAMFVFLTKTKRHTKLGRKLENLKRHKKEKEKQKETGSCSGLITPGLVERVKEKEKGKDQEKDV